MFNAKSFHKSERGQTALETAIILIAFVVVASVFAFTILSAGQSSTEKGKQAISAGLEGVQSSMSAKGAIIAKGASNKVDKVIFTLSLVAGGSPVDLTTGTDKKVVIGYRDGKQIVNDVSWDKAFVGSNNSNDLLEAGELAEITVDLASLSPALGPNTEFTIEVKPPAGAVLNISRTTPAAIGDVLELK